MSITDALRLAQEADLDLVEVAPTARPPVCKLMDFGKFKYESALKARESRKNQAQTVIKEIKIRPKIDPHDYGTKKGHVERFLRQGDKVKVTIMFRGREQSRPELGYKLLQRLAGDVEELGFVESQPKQDGRNMIMVIGPHRKKADAKPVRAPERASARASAPVASQDRVAAPAAPRATESAPGAAESAPRAAESAPRATQSAPPRTAAQARPRASPRPPARDRPARDRPGTGSASTGSASPRPEPPRPGAASSPRPSADSASRAAPRPGPPRPGPGTSGSAGAGPRPGPSGGAAGASAGTPRPSAPKPGPSGGSAGPSGNGPRPAAPRPTAPRPPAGKPGDARPVPTPRARATEPTSAEQRAAGADTGG